MKRYSSRPHQFDPEDSSFLSFSYFFSFSPTPSSHSPLPFMSRTIVLNASMTTYNFLMGFDLYCELLTLNFEQDDSCVEGPRKRVKSQFSLEFL